jgi:hypothetical protein
MSNPVLELLILNDEKNRVGFSLKLALTPGGTSIRAAYN